MLPKYTNGFSSLLDLSCVPVQKGNHLEMDIGRGQQPRQAAPHLAGRRGIRFPVSPGESGEMRLLKEHTDQLPLSLQTGLMLSRGAGPPTKTRIIVMITGIMFGAILRRALYGSFQIPPHFTCMRTH